VVRAAKIHYCVACRPVIIVQQQKTVHLWYVNSLVA